MRVVTVAAAQMGPVSRADSRSVVMDRLIAMMETASRRGAGLVVYPELALTTFFPRWYIEDDAELDAFYERAMPGPDTAPLFEKAKQLGIGFSIGYAELTPKGERFNTSILVGPDGSLLGKYRKIHLPGHPEHEPWRAFQHLEKRYFQPGNLGFRVFDGFGGRVGMCICNDRRWPETFRVMALRGAEVFMLGYNTPTRNIHHPEPAHLREFHNRLSLEAAAYQNGAWVMAAAKCGSEDGFAMIGGSAIVAPTGEVVARAVSEDDEVIAYNCDLDLGAYIRRSVFDFARHRRIEHYGPITAQTGIEVTE